MSGEALAPGDSAESLPGEEPLEVTAVREMKKTDESQTEVPNAVSGHDHESDDVVSHVLGDLLDDVSSDSVPLSDRHHATSTVPSPTQPIDATTVIRADATEPDSARDEKARDETNDANANATQINAVLDEVLLSLKKRRAKCDADLETVFDDWTIDTVLDLVCESAEGDEFVVDLVLGEVLRGVVLEAVALELQLTQNREALELLESTTAVDDALAQCVSFVETHAIKQIQNLAARKIQAAHRGNVGRKIVNGLKQARADAETELGDEIETEEGNVTHGLKPKPLSHEQPPLNKSVRRRLTQMGYEFSEKREYGLAHALRTTLFRKIDLALAFDLHNGHRGSVLDGPEDGVSLKSGDESASQSEADFDEDRAQRSGDDRVSLSEDKHETELDDSGDDEPVNARSFDSTFVPPSSSNNRTPVKPPTYGFPNLLEDEFGDYGSDEGMTDLRLIRGIANGGGTTAEKQPSPTHGASHDDRQNPSSFGAVQRKAKANELRWVAEKRAREEKALEDERRRFEILKEELEGIEKRRAEQKRQREDKKQADLELRVAREENNKLARAVLVERTAWENKCRSDALRRVKNGGTGTSFGKNKGDPLFVRMRRDFETRASVSEELARSRALEDRRVRKGGGGGGGNEFHFQTRFQRQRRERLKLASSRFLDDDTENDGGAFLPPLKGGTDGQTLHQAQIRFARQQQYGAMVKQSHKPRLSGAAREEIAKRADAKRPGFDDASWALPTLLGSHDSSTDTIRRVYDANGVGRFASVKANEVAYGYSKKTTGDKTAEFRYDVNGRRVGNLPATKNAGRAQLSKKHGPFGAFPKENQNSPVRGAMRPRHSGSNASARSPSNRTASIRAAEAAAARASAILSRVVVAVGNFDERDPLYDPKRDFAIGFDPRLEDFKSFLDTAPVPVSDPADGGVASSKKSPKGKGFRTLLRERTLVAIEARLRKELTLLETESHPESPFKLSKDYDKANAYAALDDIPCAGASTFGRTQGLKGLEGLSGFGDETRESGDSGDSLDGTEPKAVGGDQDSGEDDCDDDNEDDGDDDDDEDDDAEDDA